jgi:hypothetical protein
MNLDEMKRRAWASGSDRLSTSSETMRSQNSDAPTYRPRSEVPTYRKKVSFSDKVTVLSTPPSELEHEQRVGSEADRFNLMCMGIALSHINRYDN